MSPEEHHFENLLFAFARGGHEQYDICAHGDTGNTHWFSEDVKRAIQTCAIYIIDCCSWDPEVLGDFLHGNFTTPSSE